MNAERLRELVDFLIKSDQNLELQNKADQLQNSLQQLTSQPNEPSYQNDVVRNLDILDSAIGTSFFNELSAAQKSAIEQIKAAPFFSPQLTADVHTQLSSNALTPSVVSSAFDDKLNERRQYISYLNQLSQSLGRLGIESHTPQPGEAELGVLIPRDLFRNELDPLSKELHIISRIITHFSEASEGHPQAIEVKQISTTDPVFFLGVSAATAAAITKSISWILDTWKTALEIKELRNRAKELQFDHDDLKIFEDKVEKIIEVRVIERVAEMMAIARPEGHRAPEIENGLIWAHKALLARVERGMTIEVRFLPPPVGDGDAADPQFAEDFETLRTLAPLIEYPRPSGTPIIRLQGPNPADDNPEG